MRCEGGSSASAGARQALRRGGRSPVSAWKRCIVSGSLRKLISFQAASLRREPLKMTRLEPPAVDTPGPSGPGNGAVAQSSWRSAGRRRRNSPMFQGPVT